MLGSYLNQTAILESRLEQNEYNEWDYSEPQTIRCRAERSAKFIRMTDKESIEINNTYYTNVPVKKGDLVDGNQVLLVEVMTGLGGASEGYKVMT